jgi:hypothetical protein
MVVVGQKTQNIQPLTSEFKRQKAAARWIPTDRFRSSMSNGLRACPCETSVLFCFLVGAIRGPLKSSPRLRNVVVTIRLDGLFGADRQLRARELRMSVDESCRDPLKPANTSQLIRASQNQGDHELRFLIPFRQDRV